MNVWALAPADQTRQARQPSFHLPFAFWIASRCFIRRSLLFLLSFFSPKRCKLQQRQRKVFDAENPFPRLSLVPESSFRVMCVCVRVRVCLNPASLGRRTWGDAFPRHPPPLLASDWLAPIDYSSRGAIGRLTKQKRFPFAPVGRGTITPHTHGRTAASH